MKRKSEYFDGRTKYTIKNVISMSVYRNTEVFLSVWNSKAIDAIDISHRNQKQFGMNVPSTEMTSVNKSRARINNKRITSQIEAEEKNFPSSYCQENAIDKRTINMEKLSVIQSDFRTSTRE